ncbi:MAG: hypothetical protein AAGF23_11015, partial [Acidobacteriota bacterium]
MRRPALPALAVAALAALTLACGELPNPDLRTEPLLDERWPPDVLVESRGLEIQKAAAGQRVLAGWRFTDLDGVVSASTEPGRLGRLEIVHLEARPRTLRLALAPPSGTVTAYHRGERLTAAAVGVDGVASLELPADLPAGRVVLDLELPEGSALRVRDSGLRSTAVPGDVEVDDAGVTQSGTSFVDIVRPLRAGDRLRGRLELPTEPRDDQVFELSVEGPGGELIQKAWRPRTLERLRGAVEIDLPIDGAPSPDASPHRIRLSARGAGPPARWSDLRVEWVGPVDVPPAVDVPPPPAPP